MSIKIRKVKSTLPRVPSNLVSSFHKELQFLLRGIGETLHMQDDGFIDSCLQQIDHIKLAITIFNIDHLQVIFSKKNTPPYLKRHNEVLADWENFKSEKVERLSPENLTQLYQLRLYTYIKRHLYQIPDLPTVKNQDLAVAIENYIIIGSIQEHSFYTTGNLMTAIAVIDDIVTEIKKDRMLHQQILLF